MAKCCFTVEDKTDLVRNTVFLDMLSISHLYVYPIKSLGGIELYSARLTDRGIEHDRRWMLVGDDNRFLTQREFSKMAIFRTAIHANELTVYEKGNEADKISLTLYPTGSELTAVQIWDDVCDAIEISTEANEWFSKKLNMSCKLMYMPDASRRRVDASYALNMEITGFSDAYPLLMIGQASLDDLNSRLTTAVPMNRFRPNFVFTGGKPYEEESWKEIKIGTVSFFGVKPCGRCVVITIDQESGKKAGKDPLLSLSKYRKVGNKVLFGQNLIGSGTGLVTVGDAIAVLISI